MMRGDGDYFPRASGRLGLIAAVAALVVLTGFLAFAQTAEALPRVLRSDRSPCGTCHTDFPALTPFGRRFKLLGYTVGGGQFRTTPFPTFPTANDSRSQDDKMRAYAKAVDSGRSDDDKEYVPPISMMAIAGFTNTQASLPLPTDPFKPNDNAVISPVSGFWGGAITNNIGLLAQVTYSAPGPGGFADPFGHTWSWDNTDLRFAKSTTIGPFDFIYGITANNNPTVQDVWNTTPAWGFPYAASTIAPTPAASTMIEGAFAAHVGGLGAYVFIDKLHSEKAGIARSVSACRTRWSGSHAPGLFDGTAWRG
jgi:hypothetical protein